MITSSKIFGEAKRRWVPTQRRATACHAGGTTSGLCPSGALPPPHASAIGAASCPSAAARPSNLTGALRDEIRPSVRGTVSFQSNLERYTMSLTDQATPSHSIKNERHGAVSPPSGLNKAGRQQPRTVRLTVSLPGDLVDRLRDAVYWSPSLTLAWLVAQSLRTSLTEMESLRQCPFPKRTNALRAGRPRLLGQTMNVSPRARLTGNGTARPAEGLTQATLVSQPSIE